MNRVFFGDCRKTMRKLAVLGVRAQSCATSPPYFGLRDYGHDGQIGLEQTPDEYVAALVEVFRYVWNVLEDDGTLWLNLGDSYAANRSYRVPSSKGGKKHTNSQAAGGKRSTVPDGLKPKDLIGIPWRVALALQADGWYLRQDIIWHKPNPMPESVRDRCTKAHEYIFLLTKFDRYYFNADAIKEPSVGGQSGSAAKFKREGSKRETAIPGQSKGTHRPDRPETSYNSETRNKRSVWTVPTRGYSGAHFAVFPPQLVEPCVLAGSRPGDTVLDPFAGSGTTGQVAKQHGRQYLLCELNPAYEPLIKERLK